MNEYVQITLDRYNDFLDDNRKANVLYYIKKDLANIIDDEEFDIKNSMHNRIFKIYELLCKEI